MKIISASTIGTTFILSLGIAQAQRTAHITFIGAANAQFTQDFPTDGSIVHITNPLSISHISGTDGVTCTFTGIDHGTTTVTSSGTVDVGPPQTQVQGSCSVHAGSSSPGSIPTQAPPAGNSNSVVITFLGAANAQFDQEFRLDGTRTTITNPLSISHIASNTAGVLCMFNGVDRSFTTVSGVQTVDVGPPQTQVSGSCRRV